MDADGTKTPEVIARIEALMTQEMRRRLRQRVLKWTHRTTVKLGHELRRLGMNVCPQSVARLLKATGYSLRVNSQEARWQIASEPRPAVPVHDRVARALRRRQHPGHQRRYEDSTELVGAFRNPGAKWDRSSELVNDYDFPSDAAVPGHPVRQLRPARSNAGTVFVGRTADTPAFAVDCIEKPWRTEGRNHYPQAQSLQILADGGVQQQFHGARLVVRAAGSPLQPPRLARHRCPLPARHVEVELH